MGLGGNKHDHGAYATHNGGHYGQSSADSSCCFGTKKLSRWNVEAGFGPEFVVGGDAITGTGAHPGAIAPTIALNDVSMSDAYDTGYRAELGASYAVSTSRKITGQVYYSHADGNDVELGLQEGQILRGEMSDRKSYGVEAGVRQYMRPVRAPLVNSFRPYVEAKLGAAYVESVSLDNIREDVAGFPQTPTTLAMYEDSWVPTAAGLVGVETPLFDRMTIGVETGIRYTGTPKSDNTDVASATSPVFNARYAGINNGGERLTIPLTIRGRYRF
jgi:opacity protein-like surface antigen